MITTQAYDGAGRRCTPRDLDPRLARDVVKRSRGDDVCTFEEWAVIQLSLDLVSSLRPAESGSIRMRFPGVCCGTPRASALPFRSNRYSRVALVADRLPGAFGIRSQFSTPGR
jgi:hypothetical protein